MPKKKAKKKSVNVLKANKPKTERKDPRIEEVYEETVYFNCPVRGKVAQKVKIKRYKSYDKNGFQKHVLDSKDPLDKIEERDDGLSIYDDGEDLGITGDKEEC